MKKILSTFLIASMLIASISVSVSADNTNQINNTERVQSFEYLDEEIIPIRELEKYGFLIEWSTTEDRVYLSRTDKQITEFLIHSTNINLDNVSNMNPTNTPDGNIDSFSVSGKGYMYLKDLETFGSVNGNTVILEGEKIFISNNVEDREYIKGYTTVSKEDAKAWAKSKGANQRFIDIADLYWKYAIITGVRAEVMYAQAAFETGFGTYKGNVVPSQNNWAGIKTKYATGDRTYDHESFATPEDGVRGHYNHMLAYIGGEPVGTPHGRYYSVKSMPWAGTVKTVEELSGKWCPRGDYSNTILKFLTEMYSI